MDLIRNFKQITKEDVRLAGGKGASLGEMTRTGIPVPPGFVILATAFERFLEETDLNVEIDAILDAVNHKEIHTVENASEKIQALILEAEMPKDIGLEIKKHFQKLKSKFVAVRSSATAEDSSAAAWAGQLDTFLNTTENTLLNNVKRCWASLFTPRAIFYRFEKELHKQKISVAVVVQKMIQSEVSGIAFSVHPVTQDFDQLIIEAGFGLGEAIVSGQITPDSYVVEKSRMAILDKNINVQEKALRRSAKGGNEWYVFSKIQGESQVLTDQEILDLSKLIIQIENHYGFPCDIEWAFEQDKFYVVQSRPITTLSETKEILPEISNLSKKFLFELGNQELRPPVYNSSIFVQSSGWQTKKYIDKYYQDRIAYPLIIFVKQNEGLIFLPATKEKALAEEVLTRYWQDSNAIRKIETQFSNLSKKIEKLDKLLTYKFITSNSHGKLLESFRTLGDLLWNLNALVFFSIYLDREICERVIDKLKANISSERLSEIWPKASVPIGISFEKKRELHFLSLILKKESWQSIAEKCQYFGATYNKISSVADVEKELLAKYSKLEKTDAEKLITAELKSHKERQKDFYQWLKTLTKEEKRVAEFIQFAIEIRDARKDYIMKSIVLFYRFAESLFDKHGISKNLIMFYGMDELLKGEKYLLANTSNLENRTGGCTIFVHYDGVHEYEYGTFEKNKELVNRHYLSQHISDNDKEIKGQTGSPGIVRGLVRIITNFEDQKKDLKKGEILVTGMTRPEFVPLMKISSGIITDEGSITCHAAIVSRELKIPCIVGTKIATQVLKNGQLVEVDANNGIVRILRGDFSKQTRVKTLTNIFSREKSLLYFCVWDESDRKGIELIGEKIKNGLFIVPPKGEKGSVWYEKEELDYLKKKLLQIFASVQDNPAWATIKKLSIASWNFLKPYAIGNKEIKSVDEFEKYYDNLVNFWVCPNSFIYEIIDNKNVAQAIRKQLVAFRGETEKYTEKMSVILTDYIEQHPKLKQVFYVVTKNEVVDMLRGNIQEERMQEIKARLSGCLMLNGVVHPLNNLDRVLGENNLALEKISGDINEIRGNSAFNGLARGKVKIIHGFNDLGKISDGDVLVTQMTNPKYLPAIKKSSAIVTDEGGTLCHAAITARELKKPCVIGTKIATQVLKDKDLVEVDANKGIVTILERKPN